MIVANNFRKRIFNIEQNIYDSVKREKALECLCTSSVFRVTDNDSETALRLKRSKYSKNIIYSYLNINSIRNIFDSVRAALVNYVDIFIAAEIKINESFPTTQFVIDGFHKRLRLDVKDKNWRSISLC